MSLLAMLHTTVTPLSDYTPQCERNQKMRAALRQVEKNASKAGNNFKRLDTIAKYREVMPDWTLSTVIDTRLGQSRSTANPTLKKWLGLGIVERRNAGGEKTYNASKGYEWRLKE
jgi:hypothetical protein